jgi:hypothetical protein
MPFMDSTMITYDERVALFTFATLGVDVWRVDVWQVDFCQFDAWLFDVWRINVGKFDISS